MAGSKVLQFFLLISLMIFSTHALIVLLANGLRRSPFVYETLINVRDDENGTRQYNGCDKNNTYTAGADTTKIIVYIKYYSPLIKTTLQKSRIDKRVELAQALKEFDIELLYLGVAGFDDGDERLVGEFLSRSINLPDSQIFTIGEKPFDLIYKTSSRDLNKYVETKNVLGFNVLGTIRSIHQNSQK